jgi:polyisoprenoid-binding protein YceI
MRKRGRLAHRLEPSRAAGDGFRIDSQGTIVKKPLVRAAVAVVVVLVGVGGWLVYDNFFASEADARFSLDTIPVNNTTPRGNTSKLAGKWIADAASEAGYRIIEDTFVGEKTVTGRTSTVTGTVTLSADAVTATDITVGLASMASDRPLRDRVFRDTIMNTAEFPTATFTQTGPMTIASVPPDGTPLTVDVPGTLTVKGVAEPVTAKLQAVMADGVITVVGTIDLKLTDFGIDTPRLPGITTARDSAVVEFKLTLKKSST